MDKFACMNPLHNTVSTIKAVLDRHFIRAIPSLQLNNEEGYVGRD